MSSLNNILVRSDDRYKYKPTPQLLKWVGNKQRYAKEITQKFDTEYNKYIEPFIGTGAILGTFKPNEAVAGDILKPLVDLWVLVKNNPDKIMSYYSTVYEDYCKDKKETYDRIKAKYNKKPNPLDLLLISRSCYGGVMRFTKKGEISTPIGPHNLMNDEKFEKRLFKWHEVVQNTDFYHQDFEKTMKMAEEGDIVYCDPPYFFGQSILYGAQGFDFERLWDAVEYCKDVGARVYLSFDGKAKEGTEIRDGLFKWKCNVDRGFCMLNRFKREGLDMNGFELHDWLLITE